MLSVAMRQRLLRSLDYWSPFISLLWEWSPSVGLYISQLQVCLDGILEPETGAPSLSVTRRQLRVEICFGSLSGDILMRCPVHRRFFLIRRSSIDDSPVRSSMSLFVTLSTQVILMIEHICSITKACSLFICRVYTVQASAPYRRVDSTTCTVYLASNPHGHMVVVPESLT